ncbi:MAG: DMT family transporter [Lautropia sp.]|nr:DMT family transporter [Lautropia sp.]
MTTQKLSPGTALLLCVPPLMWAGNAIVGRVLAPLCPPITLNLLRWTLAALILLPLAWPAWRRGIIQLGLREAWRPLVLMGLLGIGCYNSFQYLALQTSSPVNVTLVAASGPLWIMLVGAVFFGVRPNLMQGVAALFSIAGVLVVLTQGQWQALLGLSLVAGDLFMLVAALCWAGYSWLLLRARVPSALREHWAAFLFVQVLFGVMWSSVAAAIELSWGGQSVIWDTRLIAGLAFVMIGPAVVAYRCWGLGVQRAGPTVAAFFSNLTPLLAALLSTVLLGEPPHVYHLVAFGLIVSGIILSARATATTVPAAVKR